MLTRNLPPDIVLAYKRYKQDTETVAGWLAERAEKAGYTANTDTAAIGKDPKLKGRARKLARDAARQAPAQPKLKYTYIVKTTEFVPMAKHVSLFRQEVRIALKEASIFPPRCYCFMLTRCTASQSNS